MIMNRVAWIKVSQIALFYLGDTCPHYGAYSLKRPEYDDIPF